MRKRETSFASTMKCHCLSFLLGWAALISSQCMHCGSPLQITQHLSSFVNINTIRDHSPKLRYAVYQGKFQDIWHELAVINHDHKKVLSLSCWRSQGIGYSVFTGIIAASSQEPQGTFICTEPTATDQKCPDNTRRDTRIQTTDAFCFEKFLGYLQ